MRPYLFALPVAFVLALAGGLMMYAAGRGPQEEALGIDFGQPRHLVTAEMEVETAAMSNLRAPIVEGKTDLGKPVVLAPESAKRPEFVLFIKEGCPCSIDAQSLFNRLARKFAGKIDFYGVIDADVPKAREYSNQFSVAFPVVADSDLKVIHAYKAGAAAYSALIARNGHIVKMWPGYCVSYLKEMNTLLSKEAAVKETPFDPQYAPVKKAAGCAFATNW